MERLRVTGEVTELGFDPTCSDSFLESSLATRNERIYFPPKSSCLSSATSSLED